MTKRARQAAGRKGGKRGGKSRSDAKATAARKNGKKGGRKRIDLSEDFKEIGPAPMSDPLAMNEWAQKVNARMLELIIAGRGNRELVQHVAKLTRGIIGTTPNERIHQASKRIKAAQAPRKPVARKGPEMVPVNDAGDPGTGGGTSLRR